MRGRRENNYHISEILQEAQREKIEKKVVERTILTCETAQSAIEMGIWNYLESLKVKQKTKYEYSRERKRDFQVGKKKIEHKPLFYIQESDDDEPKKEEAAVAEVKVETTTEEPIAFTSKYDYNKNRKRDFSQGRMSPKKGVVKQEKEPEVKPDTLSLEALSAKQEQTEKQKSEKELEEAMAKSKYQYNQERKRNFTFGKVSWTPKEDPLLAAIKKTKQEPEKIQISPYPVAQIDPNNYLRSYKYENFQDTIKQLQYYQYHAQFHNIIKLDLSNQVLDDERIDILSSCLKQQQALTLLNLSKNKITDKGIYSLAQILRSLPSLKSLNLSWNAFTDYALKVLTDERYYSSSIQEYNFSFNSLTTLSAYYLCFWYSKDYHSQVKRLILGGLVHFTNRQFWGIEFLQLFIGRLLSLEIQRLEELTLYPFNLEGEDGFDCLLLLLFANRSGLKVLNISHNFIFNYYYRQFFLQIVEFITKRNQDYAESFANRNQLNPPGGVMSFEPKSFQLLAYDCGFSLIEIQYFQKLFIQSAGIEKQSPFPSSMVQPMKFTKPPQTISSSSSSSRANSLSGKGREMSLALPPPTAPQSRQPSMSTVLFVPSFDHQPTIFSLQQYTNIKWKSLLMLAGRLYAIYYHCLFTIYQVHLNLFNSWKLSAPMKYRPPIVLTSKNASKYRSPGGRRSSAYPKSSSKYQFDDDLPSIESLIPSNQVRNYEVQFDDEVDDEDEKGSLFQDPDNSSITNQQGDQGSLMTSSIDKDNRSNSSLPRITNTATAQSPISKGKKPSSPSASIKKQQQQQLQNSQESVDTDESNETYIFENEQSLLANLTKRLNFPLELLFQDRKSSFYLLKASILQLNDELNYVHFYQELIGQLNTLQYTHKFFRSTTELAQLYQDLEKYNQFVIYTSIFQDPNKENTMMNRLDRVEEIMEEDHESVAIAGNKNLEGGGGGKSNEQHHSHPHHPSKPMLVSQHSSLSAMMRNPHPTSSLAIALSRQNSHQSLTSDSISSKHQPSSSSQIPPPRIIEKVFTDELIQQQIDFFVEIQNQSKYYLMKWSQCIDECLVSLERLCTVVYQKNFQPIAITSSSNNNDKINNHNNAINRKTIIKRKDSLIRFADQEQIEQMLFQLEDCYSHTIRLGMINEEYIGCLYQQNIIHYYVTHKQSILQSFRQREEQEQFEIQQKEQAKLQKQESRRQQHQQHRHHHHHHKHSESNDATETEGILAPPMPLLPTATTEGEVLKTSSKYHLKHHLHDIKKLITEDERDLAFLSLSFYQYLHREININFEDALSYLSYFFHYYCFIYQKEKYKV